MFSEHRPNRLQNLTAISSDHWILHPRFCEAGMSPCRASRTLEAHIRATRTSLSGFTLTSLEYGSTLEAFEFFHYLQYSRAPQSQITFLPPPSPSPSPLSHHILSGDQSLPIVIQSVFYVRYCFALRVAFAIVIFCWNFVAFYVMVSY
jgi:hypothetical protein